MTHLIDANGNFIEYEDIIMCENLKARTVVYYLVGKNTMYRYDENGMFKHDFFSNIHIDMGMSLVNDDNSKWTRLGSESEVYDEIFN